MSIYKGFDDEVKKCWWCWLAPAQGGKPSRTERGQISCKLLSLQCSPTIIIINTIINGSSIQQKIFLSPVLYILRRYPSWKASPPYSCELTLSQLGWLYIIDQKWNCFWKNLFYLTGTKSPKPMVESVMKQKYMPVIFNLA